METQSNYSKGRMPRESCRESRDTKFGQIINILGTNKHSFSTEKIIDIMWVDEEKVCRCSKTQCFPSLEHGVLQNEQLRNIAQGDMTS